MDRSALVLLLAIQVAFGLLGARIWTASRNSLAGSGAWVSTKATLERGVIGAEQFLRAGQAVAGQRLQLGAWHGYQEVIYREPVDPVELRCTLVLHPRAHGSVVFNKSGRGFSGVRISLDPLRPSMLFTASADGEFLERTPLAVPALDPKAPHAVTLRFEDGALSVGLDGAVLGRFPIQMSVPQQVGFRGGGRMAIVDDIAIRKRGDRSALAPDATVYETFAPPSPLPAFLAVLSAGLLVNAAVLWTVLPRRERPREVVLGAVMANLTLCVIAGGVLGLVMLRSARYPAADAALLSGQQAWRMSEADEIRGTLRTLYPSPPAANVSRVLFLGSSQTWGAGAARKEEVMTRVLERMLNAKAEPGHRYEVANGGISATVSGDLLQLYEKEWIHLRPHLVVVNLSHNDFDMALFRANLRRLAQLSRAKGIATLFVLEANSGEERKAALDEIASHHAVMREAAAAEGVPVVDMHARLLTEQDRGFLFWDAVHMSSLGQRLFAEHIYPDVKRLLDVPSP